VKGKLTAVKCTTCDRWVSPDGYNMAVGMCVPCAVVSESRLADLKSRWAHVMTACKLTVRHYGTLYTPRLLAVQCRPTFDVVTLGMVPGQMAADYTPHTTRFAKALGVHQVKVLPSRSPDLLRLLLLHTDPLAPIVRPLSVPAMPDYTALPMARTETGETWALKLFGHQVLVVGAIGSGKGSVAWSFLRALAWGIATGTVAVWGFDPKGGMEFTLGAPMFARLYADKPDEMAAALDERCTSRSSTSWPP
jgi:S-DNA-T family DNA segregation ATPase FtsK/SpoIIIE